MSTVVTRRYHNFALSIRLFKASAVRSRKFFKFFLNTSEHVHETGGRGHPLETIGVLGANRWEAAILTNKGTTRTDQ